MNKQEFLTICGSTLAEMGFVKKYGAYYLRNHSDLVGAVFLRKSSCGNVYYVECTLTIEGYNVTFPYPKYYDADLSTRIPFPLKERLAYNPSATLGYSVDLERHTEDEIREYLKKGIADWLMPALREGKQYILDHWEQYRLHHLSEKVHAALIEWSSTGNMPVKDKDS